MLLSALHLRNLFPVVTQRSPRHGATTKPCAVGIGTQWHRTVPHRTVPYTKVLRSCRGAMLPLFLSLAAATHAVHLDREHCRQTYCGGQNIDGEHMIPTQDTKTREATSTGCMGVTDKVCRPLLCCCNIHIFEKEDSFLHTTQLRSARMDRAIRGTFPAKPTFGVTT